MTKNPTWWHDGWITSYEQHAYLDVMWVHAGPFGRLLACAVMLSCPHCLVPGIQACQTFYTSLQIQTPCNIHKTCYVRDTQGKCYWAARCFWRYVLFNSNLCFPMIKVKQNCRSRRNLCKKEKNKTAVRKKSWISFLFFMENRVVICQGRMQSGQPPTICTRCCMQPVLGRTYWGGAWEWAVSGGPLSRHSTALFCRHCPVQEISAYQTCVESLVLSHLKHKS